MDFSNRNAQAQPATPAPTAAGPTGSAKKNKPVDGSKWSRIGAVGAVAAVVILLVALVASVALSGGSNNGNEKKFVDNSKLQAVFLNTGQVYFGKIKDLNNKYFVVSNIYYLQTSGGAASGSTPAANTSVSLVKLGCELHEPYDQMVINRDQVTFWENLQDNGQVAQAVKTFVKQNPSGQKCADQSTSAGTGSSNSVQSAGSNNGSTTPGSSTPSTSPSNSTPTTKP